MQKMRCFGYRNNSLAADAVQVISGRVGPRDMEAYREEIRRLSKQFKCRNCCVPC